MKNKGTWKDGDTDKYIDGEEIKVKAGLFFYSGFGMGTLYRSGGAKVSCCSSEATKMCREDGIDCHTVDKFTGYNSPYLGD